jgi:tRNA nucleotidyltransferase/poly(A) polymerase
MIRVNAEVQPIYDRLCELIRSAGGWPLLVGGCVRDLLLGLTPHDLDLEVYGLDPDRLLAVLRQEFDVNLVGQDFGVPKIHHYPIDISLPRRVLTHLAEKAAVSKKTASDFFDAFNELAYKEAKNTFTIPGAPMPPARIQ